jgi:hypothetical protein
MTPVKTSCSDVIKVANVYLFALSAIVLVMGIYCTTRKILPIGDQEQV